MTEAHPSLEEDEIVRSVLAGLGGPGIVCMKSGWVGASPREGYSRLYIATPEFSEFLEFQDEDCIHRLKLSPEHSPFGGSVLWFKGDTRFSYTRTSPPEAQASFLEGEIRKQVSADIAIGQPVVATGLPCIIVISLLACTIFNTCHHFSGECQPPDT